MRDRIKESCAAQDAAIKAHEKALKELRVQRAREERLRLQMDLLDKRAKEAIAVEEREISKLEQKELVIEFTKPSKELALNFSLST